MFWARVDNRLVHGQIIETWIPFTEARVLLVANDELSRDVLKQEIMSLAIPGDVKALFTPVDRIMSLINTLEKSEVLVLFSSCGDARKAYEAGLDLAGINIGNLHYGPGKKQLCAHVALSVEDESCLRYFMNKGVELDFRCVPTEHIQVKF